MSLLLVISSKGNENDDLCKQLSISAIFLPNIFILLIYIIKLNKIVYISIIFAHIDIVYSW